MDCFTPESGWHASLSSLSLSTGRGHVFARQHQQGAVGSYTSLCCLCCSAPMHHLRLVGTDSSGAATTAAVLPSALRLSATKPISPGVMRCSTASKLLPELGRPAFHHRRSSTTGTLHQARARGDGGVGHDGALAADGDCAGAASASVAIQRLGVGSTSCYPNLGRPACGTVLRVE